MEGCTFVVSGVLDSLERDEAEDFIKRHGGKVTSAVSGKTTYLLVGVDCGKSKYAKAKSVGTPLMDEDGLFAMVEALAEEAGVDLTTASVGGMFGFFFHPGPVRDFGDARKADAAGFRRFFAAMLEAGIYLAPSPFEAGFVSLAHRPKDIAETLDAARSFLRKAGSARGVRRRRP